MTSSIPEGFQLWTPSSAFMDHLTRIGAVYRSIERNAMGLYLQTGHTNMHEVAHGGFMATLADCAFGTIITHECQSPVVTVSMTLDYLLPGRVGDWLEAVVTVDKPGKRLIYASCTVYAGGKAAVKASGIFVRAR